MKLNLQLLFILFTMTISKFSIAAVSCQNILSTKISQSEYGPEVVVAFLENLTAVANNSFLRSHIGVTDARVGLESSEVFKKFISNKGLENNYFGLNENQKTELISYFFNQQLTFLKNDNLRMAQDVSLKKILVSRSEKKIREISELTGRQILEQISAINLKRYLKFYSASIELAQKDRQFKRIENWFSNLELVFFHNRPLDGPVQLKMPLMSTSTLRSMGLNIGLTNMAFNRWLQSDESVYFHVEFKNKSTPLKSFTSEYGNNILTIDNAYAEANGWISAYVMYPDDLIRTIGYSFKSQKTDEYLESFGTKLNSQDSTDFDWNNNYKADPKFWISLRKSQGLLDFTVQDFKSFTKIIFLGELSLLNQKDPQAFKEAVKEILKSQEPSNTISDYGYSPANLQIDWEFKIQISTPESQITVIQ